MPTIFLSSENGIKDAQYLQGTNEPSHEKTNIWVSDQVRQKPACAVTEAS